MCYLKKFLVFPCLLLLISLFTCNVIYAVTINNPYLQYRTYDSSEDKWRGWIGAKVDGEPIEKDTVTSIEMFDNDGNKIDNANFEYWSAPKYYYSWWNKEENKIEYDNYSYAGYMVKFPDSQTFESGNYTYSIETNQGKSDSQEIYLPDKEILPTVNKESINYTWNADNSLTINWNHPVSTGFVYYQLFFMDGDSNDDVLYLNLYDTEKTSITIPSSLMNDVLDLYNSNSLLLRLETMKENKNNMDYAQGNTLKEINVLDDEGVYGTWSGKVIDDNGDKTEFTMEIKQSGNDLEVSGSTEEGDHFEGTGTISGDTIEINIDDQDQTQLVGTLSEDGTKVNGAMEEKAGDNTGTWSMSKDDGGGDGSSGCLINPKASFGLSWLFLLIIPAFMFVRRKL